MKNLLKHKVLAGFCFYKTIIPQPQASFCLRFEAF